MTWLYSARACWGREGEVNLRIVAMPGPTLGHQGERLGRKQDMVRWAWPGYTQAAWGGSLAY